MPFVHLTEDIFLIQLSRGDDAVGENPWLSRAYDTAPMQRVLAMPGVLDFRADMCAHGLRHYRSQRLVQKASRLIATHSEYQLKLGATMC